MSSNPRRSDLSKIISRGILLPDYDTWESTGSSVLMEYLERIEAKPHDRSEPPLVRAGPSWLRTDPSLESGAAKVTERWRSLACFCREKRTCLTTPTTTTTTRTATAIPRQTARATVTAALLPANVDDCSTPEDGSPPFNEALPTTNTDNRPSIILKIH